MVHFRVDVCSERRQWRAGAEVRQVLCAGSDDADDVESAIPCVKRVVYSGRVDGRGCEIDSHVQCGSLAQRCGILTGSESAKGIGYMVSNVGSSVPCDAYANRVTGSPRFLLGTRKRSK
jgi:hypothetical protein